MKLDNLKDKNLIQGDLGVWAVFILLCTISLIEVYSASSRMTFGSEAYWQPIMQHGAFMLMGVNVEAHRQRLASLNVELLNAVDAEDLEHTLLRVLLKRLAQFLRLGDEVAQFTQFPRVWRVGDPQTDIALF